MAKDNVSKKLLTAKGELTGYISLFTPSTKFDTDGVYQCNILLPEEEGVKIAEAIKEVRTEQFKKYGKGSKVTDLTQCVPYTTVDDETGEEIPDEQGRYVLKTKAKAYIKDGVPTNTVKVLDSKLNVIKNASVGAGTVAKLGVVLDGYTVAKKTGVSVKLKMVQIINLVEYNSNSIESFGFEAEDGFEGSEENFKEAPTKPLKSNNTAETCDDEDDEEVEF